MPNSFKTDVPPAVDSSADARPSPSPELAGGQVQALRGNTQWLLHEAGVAWKVRRGHVNIFSVRVQDGVAAGLRKNMFQAVAGDWIFGFNLPPDHTGLDLLAVCADDVELVRFEKGELDAQMAGPGSRAELCRGVHAWLTALGSGMPRPPRPDKPVQEGSADAEQHVATGSLWVPPPGWVVIRLREGRCLLYSHPYFLLVPEIGWVPVGPSTWIEAQSDCVMEVDPLESALTPERFWPLLDAVRDRILDTLMVMRVLTHEWSRARLADRDKALEQTFEQSLLRQAAMLDDEVRRLVDVESSDHLLAACQLVGKQQDIQFRAPSMRGWTQTSRDPVRAIARASKVKMRDVELAGEWWRGDHGPLLGFLSEHRYPVALLTISARRYQLVDPRSPRPVPVTAELASQLDPVACMFYRPLPDELITGRQVVSYALKGLGGDIWMIVGVGILSGLLSLLLPLMTEVIFNTIIPVGELSQLGQIGLGLVVAALAMAVFNLTSAFALLRIEGKSDNALQAAVWDRLLSLPASFFRQYSAGDLALRVTGINSIRQMLSGSVISAGLSGMFSIFNLVLMFYYSWKLTILAMVLAAIAWFASYLVARFKIKYSRESLAWQGKQSGLILQLITAVAKLRDTHSEARAFSNWSNLFMAKKDWDIRTTMTAVAGSTFNAFYPLFCTLCTFAAYYFFLQGQLNTGQFLAYNSAFGQLMASLMGMGSVYIALLAIRPIYDRAKPILITAPEVDLSKTDPGELTGRVELGHIAFRYQPDSPLILRDLSLKVEPGDYVAIVGPSGAGKSTLVRLLLGFESPECGEVLYDNQDLRTLDLGAVRRQLSVVLQNGQVFSGDIYHNIVGATKRSVDEAWAAARAAGLEEDIKEMPMGMYTYIAEGGATLSGGQRQRLMIARAIVNDPRIVLFDEATSYLDNRTQAVVTETLKAMTQATRIVIAHRLSTIVDTDRIYVLDGGCMVQSGRYQDLIDQPGLFRDLASRQRC